MRLRHGWVGWEAFWGNGVPWSEWGIGSRLPLVTGQGGSVGVDFEPFAGTYLFDVINVKPGNMALEQCHALEELTLDALSMATRREGLTMTILLLASGTGGRASGTSGILRIAL